ncbi:MAG: lamin tail domain-containing protein [Euzebyales bacterium]|nr:lamin tail domain-containing protein [Euzebyales bacterium]
MLRAVSRMAMVLCALSLGLSALPALAAPGGVVISEFRFRGPAGGNDEFVELHNTGSSPVPIGGWQLQGCVAASGAPSPRSTVPAGTSLPAGAHYLFANANAADGYSGSAIPDATYGTGLSDEGGARITAGDGTVRDGVGSSSGAVDQCREGSGLSLPSANGDNGFERRAGGTQDTDDNAADFAGPKASQPQNLSGDEVEPDPEPEPTPINQIQGAGAASPLSGRTVVVEGVVTGVDDEIGASFSGTFPEDAGIFIQSLAADEDTNPATSEGIFIGYVRDRDFYQPGMVVTTQGQVKEKFGFTMISEDFGLEPEIIGTADVPAPVTIDPALAAAQDPFDRAYFETLEGMRVRLATGTANSGGTNKFGELFLTPGTERNRVFRTDPAPDLLATDADAGAGDPNNPFKPAAPSTTLVRGDLFDRVDDVVGPFAFSFSHFKIMVQEGNLPTVTDGPTEFPFSLAPAGANQLRVASFNVENFFPPGIELDLSDVTQEEFDEKRDRLADAISDLLDRPAVLAVQEVYDKATLQALADDLGGYTAYLEEGNDERGIDVGFLIADGVNVGDVTQYGKDATGPEGFSCSDVRGGLYDRPPLAIEVSDGAFAATVFSNHFSSKSAPDECRQAQAAFLEDIVAELEDEGREVIVTGDLNAFEDESALDEFTDGGTTLRNLWSDAPAEERYSFAFSGKLQTLDHMLVTEGLDDRVDDFRYAHFDNDYYEREDPTDGHHVADHDPPLGTFSTSPCADPDARETVIVEGTDTDVPNRELDNGCTINDVLPRRADFDKKGDYVAAVSAKTNELKADGVISGREKGQIMRVAAKVD